MRIAIDWDDSFEYEHNQEEALKWIKDGHYVEIVTTRFEDPSKYTWFKADKNMNEPLYEFAKKAGISYHFMNYTHKASYVDDKFDYLVDDNDEEGQLLNKCRFISVYQIEQFTERLLNEAKNV